jgi:hypothetical protein
VVRNEAARDAFESQGEIPVLFDRLKDWPRIATRYDRCPTVFFSATTLAPPLIFWL